MKRQRQEAITRAIRDGVVKSQNELVELLAHKGFSVSQTTVSRDLRQLGLARKRGPLGKLAYSVEPSENIDQDTADMELRRTAPLVLLATEPSGNVVVVKTTPGNAQGLAWALDRAAIPGIAGTVAGDDTIMVVCSRDADGAEIAQKLMKYALGER